jgi:hypothetical protein
VILWNLLGRAEEVSHIRNSQFKFNKQTGAVTVDLVRTKGNSAGKITIKALFMNRDNFEECPLHSLGTSFIVNDILDEDYTFPGLIHGPGVAAHINDVFFFDKFRFSKHCALNWACRSAHLTDADMAQRVMRMVTL